MEIFYRPFLFYIYMEITERSKQAFLNNFKQNSPNVHFDCLDYLAEQCVKYEYDSLYTYYDDDFNCIDVTMFINETFITITKWFDDEEEYMVEIYDKDKKSICVVGSEDSVKRYFNNENWRENFA